MTKHLEGRTLWRFLNGGMSPERLLAADRHLATCARCRRRGLRALRPRLTARVLHGILFPPDGPPGNPLDGPPDGPLV